MNDGREESAAGAKRVLIVDRDRMAALISRMLVENYSADVATDGLKAVQKLRTLLPSVIVADTDVPGSGLRLAELVGMSPKYRGIPIILTSARPSPDIVIKARNAGANSYLAKPFGPRDLQGRIDQALSPRALQETSEESTPQNPEADAAQQPETQDGAPTDIIGRVRQIEGLPPFPATHAEIMKLAQSENATSTDIADKIQFDPDLLAMVFKLVNSSYYGFRKQIDSLKLAVTLLGLEELANLVMTAQVFQKLGNYESETGLDIQALWKHLVGTAFVARAIAKKLKTEEESAFLSGMLHDLGKVVLDCFFSDYYAAVLEMVKAEDVAIAEAEMETLGISHSDVGGQLAVAWKFADKYQTAILHHHSPERATRFGRLVGLVHLANALCRQQGYGSGGDNHTPDIDEAVLERFALGSKGLQILTEAAQKDLEDADSFLSALAN